MQNRDSIACCGSGKKRRSERASSERFLRDMQGTATEKLLLFKRLKTAGAFVNEPTIGVAEAEKTLRMLAAMDKK
jgi:hypothetical protein